MNEGEQKQGWSQHDEERMRKRLKVEMSEKREQYEYETIQIIPGGMAWAAELNALGENSYHLVGVIPLVQISYIGSGPGEVSNGQQLIFERRKEIE